MPAKKQPASIKITGLETLEKMNCCKPSCSSGSGGAIYGIGFLGALYYYVTTATGIWMGVIGIVKAIFWPAVLVYGGLKFLGL